MTFSSVIHYLMTVKAERIEESLYEEALFLTEAMENLKALGGFWERTFPGFHFIPSPTLCQQNFCFAHQK